MPRAGGDPAARRSTTTWTRSAAENLLRYLADQAAADRRGPRRPHDRDRALPRRARRLAGLRADAVRQPRPRAVGMAAVERARAETRARRRDDVDRRRVRGAVAGDGERRRIRRCCCPRRTKSRRSCCGSSAARRCSRRSSARPRRARCCCRGAGRAARARSGSSASAPPICWRSPRGIGSFPMLLETYRECLRDVFDMPALRRDAARGSSARDPRRHASTRAMPSPFAVGAALRLRRQLHLRRRRAAGRAAGAGARRSIRRSCASCWARRSCASCSTPTRSPTSSAQLQQLDPRLPARARSTASTICCCSLGDLTPTRSPRAARIAADSALGRAGAGAPARSPVNIGGAAAIHPGRIRRALSRRAGRAACRSGCPSRCSSPCAMPRWISRAATRARTGRSRPPSSRRRYGARPRDRRSAAESARGGRPAARGRVPSRRHRPRVVRRRTCCRPIRRRSLAQAAQGGRAGRTGGARPARSRRWQGVVRQRAAASTRCSTRSRTCRARPSPHRFSKPRSSPARVDGYSRRRSRRALRRPAKSCGAASSRSAIATAASRCISPTTCSGSIARRLVGELSRARRGDPRAISETHGASFFAALHEAGGGGYPGETVDALWDLVWKGAITNDTFHALRAFTRPPERRSRKPAERPRLPKPARRPRLGGRSLVADSGSHGERCHRHAVVHRDGAAAPLALRRGDTRGGGAEGFAGGFGAVYDVLKALEDAGASAADISSAASARRSSRCRRARPAAIAS